MNPQLLEAISPYLQDSAVIIDGSSVANLYWGDPERYSFAGAGTLAPPFPTFAVFMPPVGCLAQTIEGYVVEFTSISTHAFDGFLNSLDDGLHQIFPMDTKERIELHGHQTSGNQMHRESRDARWLIYLRLLNVNHEFRFAIPYRELCFLSQDGECNALYGITPNVYGGPEERLCGSWFAMSGWLTVSLLHCKNITMTEGRHARFAMRQAERRGRPLRRFHVLEVEPLKFRSMNPGRQKPTGEPATPLHICRGHFATYSPEKPLFGKHSGTYWIPQHIKGNASNGIVNKQYEVKL